VCPGLWQEPAVRQFASTVVRLSSVGVWFASVTDELCALQRCACRFAAGGRQCGTRVPCLCVCMCVAGVPQKMHWLVQQEFFVCQRSDPVGLNLYLLPVSHKQRLCLRAVS
jgi:hypothetical protein